MELQHRPASNPLGPRRDDDGDDRTRQPRNQLAPRMEPLDPLMSIELEHPREMRAAYVHRLPGHWLAARLMPEQSTR